MSMFFSSENVSLRQLFVNSDFPPLHLFDNACWGDNNPYLSHSWEEFAEYFWGEGFRSVGNLI